MPLIAALVSAVALMGQTAPVQSTPSQDSTTVVPDVEVTARRQSAYEAARRFADQAVETPPGRGLARWAGKVCVGVVNMRPDAAQPLIDRISYRLEELDIGFGEPGCEPNIVIIAADDGAAAARSMVAARPRAFDTGISGTNLTDRALQAFQESTAPVRWWRLTVPVDADTGQVTVRLAGEEPMTRGVRGPSRIRSQDRNVFARTFVILDVSRIGGVDTNALGDYLAMVSLAQIEADADFSGYASILNLFSDPAGVREMSDWDLSFLQALYSAELSERRTSHQIGSVAGSMARAGEAEETAGPK
jgi:hypothetical protein